MLQWDHVGLSWSHAARHWLKVPEGCIQPCTPLHVGRQPSRSASEYPKLNDRRSRNPKVICKHSSALLLLGPSLANNASDTNWFNPWVRPIKGQL